MMTDEIDQRRAIFGFLGAVLGLFGMVAMALYTSGGPEGSGLPALNDTIAFVALGMAALGVLLGLTGLFNQEPPALSFVAVGMGGAGVIMYYSFWLAVIMAAISAVLWLWALLSWLGFDLF